MMTAANQVNPATQPCGTCASYNGGNCSIGGDVQATWRGCVAWKSQVLLAAAAPSHGVIIHPDLSQLEYRLIAHETREPKLIKAFRNGEDIHDNMTFDMLGHKPVDKAERKIYKTVNYAVVYDVGLNKFVYLTELTKEVAKPLYYKAKGHYPYIDEFKADMKYELLEKGSLKLYNIFGRIRYIYLYEFAGETAEQKARNAIREAFNWIFQSSGHDVYKVWCMETVDRINDPSVLLIDDVHDEFVLDVPSPKVEHVVEVVKFVGDHLNELIETAYGIKLRVPLEIEIEKGDHWK